jgi:hypothetical protein
VRQAGLFRRPDDRKVLRDDPDLAPLRQRADFRLLVEEVEKEAK